MTTRPPCWSEGQKCPNDCAAALLQQQAHNHFNLTGPWSGWRLRGRDLVGPGGERVSPERLRGLLWREAGTDRASSARNRREATPAARGRQPVKVVVIELADFLVGGVTAG